MKRVFTITSGKGGVGKTNICVNLAVQLAREGLRTCIFDADLGLANINILLGISPEYDLEDVIEGEKNLSDIMIHDPSGTDVIPGATGVEKLATLTPENLSRLIDDFSCLDGYDILLFDTSAGISREVTSFCMASKEVILVIIPEPTSLTDGYSLLKVLSLNGYRDPVKVVVNQAKNERVAQTVFDKFSQAVQKFLPLKVLYMGCLPSEESVAEAVARQQPFVTLYPAGRASEGIARLARNLLNHGDSKSSYDAFDSFWEKFANVTQTPLKLPQKKSANVTKIPLKLPPNNTKKKVNQISCDDPSGSRPPGPTPRSEADNSMSELILESLNRIVSVAIDISTELKEIRRVLGKPSENESATLVPEPDDPKEQPTPIIELDFEAYVERKSRSKSARG